MSCSAGKPNFWLLDSYTGWNDQDRNSSRLEGFEDSAGIRLSLVDDGAIDPAQVSACIPPSRLARGCGACEWFLVTPFRPASRLMHRDACHMEWSEKWEERFAPVKLQDATAIATWRRFVAIADRGANRIYILSQFGSRLVAQIACDAPGAIAFTPRGEILATFGNSSQIARYGLDGRLRGLLASTAPGNVDRLVVDRNLRIWLVTVAAGGAWSLWKAGFSDTQFLTATLDQLKAAFPASGVASEAKEGFCLGAPGAGNSASCYSWYGRALNFAEMTSPQPPQRQSQGQLLTEALDSGIPRCKWHRVRLDADILSGTTLEVSVATTEDPSLPAQGNLSPDPKWLAFPAGSPHPSDWTSAPADSRDFLIQQPPGRYLYLRLRFTTSDSTSTPVVRRVRLDFPRITSIQHLPDIYRENPQAEEFTERFLSLFDSLIEDVDSVISRYPALLDPAGVPDQLLPWLAKFFDIGFDPTWDAARRRALLQNAPKLYRERGTPAGLRDALKLIFGVAPAIAESNATGPWGAIGDRGAITAARCTAAPPPPSVRRTARLHSVRLFGKTRVRFRLGSSPLCGAPMRSYGNPDLDPFAEGSYRFRVLVPPLADNSKQAQQRFINLVEAQKPAHTVASVRFGGTGFLLGYWSAVGVDTGFVPLAAPVLGTNGNVRLGRMSVLWNRSGGPAAGTRVGVRSVVGIQTIAG
jgi:phage tail-like protein